MDTSPHDAPAAQVHQLHHSLPPAQQATAETRDSLLRLAAVEGRTGLKKSSIYAGMKAGTFPKCLRLHGGRSVAWPQSRIDAWVAAQIDAAEVKA